MGSLGGGGKWGLFGMGPNDFNDLNSRRRRRRSNGESKASNSGDIAAGTGYRFPMKQAVTAASLAFTGDTIAQVRQRWVKHKDTLSSDNPMDVVATLFSEHDWIRALRLTSYAFLLYGPGSYAWYQFLDRKMPTKTAQTLLAKVMLNQILLGPTVTTIVFAWNTIWLGKFSQFPQIYQNDAIPALLFGYRFWIPITILNFWLVPLQFRVAYMCTGNIFWNFYLSSTMNKVNPADKNHVG